MKPGPELDALVAEKVMGFCLHLAGFNRDIVHDEQECSRCETMVALRVYREQRGWSPSTEIAAAWEVWERFDDTDIEKATGPDGKVWWDLYIGLGGEKYVTVAIEETNEVESVEHAICLVTLKAVGMEVE